jgi:hypothetical protein
MKRLPGRCHRCRVSLTRYTVGTQEKPIEVCNRCLTRDEWDALEAKRKEAGPWVTTGT